MSSNTWNDTFRLYIHRNGQYISNLKKLLDSIALNDEEWGEYSRRIGEAKVCNENHKQGTVANNCQPCKSIGIFPTHAAAAPSNSCLLALVNRASAAEKSKVATSNIPIQIAFDVFAFFASKDEPTWYKAQTGTTKSASTMTIMRKLTSRSTRALVGRNKSSSVVFKEVSFLELTDVF